MFPIPWNFPLRKKNGNLVNIGDAIDEGSDLPAHGESDAGKILSVDVNGDLEWSNDISSEIQTLTNKVDVLMNNGSVNLLPNNATTDTINGVTFTVNSDGTVTANGTATANANLVLYSGVNLLKSGTYRLTGALDANNIIRITDPFSDNYPTDTGNGVEFTITSAMQASNLYIFARVSSGQTLNNAVFKPMISDVALGLSYEDYQPYAKTNRELTTENQTLTNKVANITNPNLLDNPWFTVNQRGITSWSNEGAGYSADRWKHDGSATGNITDGVYTCNAPTYQNWEDERITPLLGKTVTLSWLLSDGSIGFETKTLPTALTSEFVWPFTNSYVTLALKSGNVSQAARIIAGVAVKAVKLEFGEVSTLASDTVPSYQQELAKCQRYFQVIPKTSSFRIVAAVNTSPYVVDAIIPLPVTMRAKPSIINNGVELDINSLDGLGFAGTGATIPTLPAGSEYSYIMIRVAHNNGAQVSDGVVYIYGAPLQLSADL